MRLLLVLVAIPVFVKAQLTTGMVEGSLHGVDGRPAKQVALAIANSLGFRIDIQTNADGRFTFSAPYGRYTLRAGTGPLQATGVSLDIEPLRTIWLTLVIDSSGGIKRAATESDSNERGTPNLDFWLDRIRNSTPLQGFSLQSVVAGGEAGSVSVPIDFSGLGDNRLTLLSERAFSWTSTQFKLQGLDATDSYQPGRPAILPDVQSLADVVLRTGTELLTANSYGSEGGAFLTQPDGTWHGAVSTVGTGAALSWNNLPRASGMVQQAERFQWLTRDGAEMGGPIAPWADLFAAAAGQWASQSVGTAPPGQNQNSRALFLNVRGDIRAGARDRIEAAYSGSRLALSNWGMPAGVEALASRRLSPEFNLPDGFSNEAENNSFEFVQLGWTHQRAAATIQARYGYSVAHLDSWPANQTSPNQSRIELLGSSVSGAPPLQTTAARPRYEIAVVWQPAELDAKGSRHNVTVGGNWELSSPRNEMSAPSDLNLITAGGLPAFVVEYNAPVTSVASVQNFSAYAADHIAVGRGLSFDLGLLSDSARGSLPAQNSAAGSFTGSRSYPGSGDLISWNNASPRAGFSWRVPWLSRLLMGGGYRRTYSPLAGRYLDYGNPNSIGGSVFEWIDRNGDGWFQPGEQGPLLMRFGGPYSSISRTLQRPYADEFDVTAQAAMGSHTFAGLELFRRDEKHRIVAVDTGLGANAFTPVPILDPGPDGIPGTFDDQHLVVYSQNPATFGRDEYTLTNAPGLRELNVGFTAQIRTAWRGFSVGASFTAEKAWGPTNPGNAVFENDPDVIGTLFIDPNSTNPTLARSYVDRAYLGKIQALYRLPSGLGKLEIANLVNYTDGLPFARELLVSGLAQGPFLIPTTVRGSPEGGNRAQYVLNWNLRVMRNFELSSGRVEAFADLLNVLNSHQVIEQTDLTGVNFNMRLPIAIQPSRFVRLGLSYTF